MIYFIFINQDYEIFERRGFLGTVEAEEYAETLAKQHNCPIDFCELISVVEPPAKGEDK